MFDTSKNFLIRLVLTQFIGASIKMVDNEDGCLEECVCIPLERNNLKKTPNNNVNVYVFMNHTNKVNYYGWTHYLKMKISPVFLKKLKDLGMENPFLGNAKRENTIMDANLYANNYVKIKNDE